MLLLWRRKEKRRYSKLSTYDYDKDIEKFAEETKALLSGYLPDEHPTEYLSTEIAKLHKQHVINAIQHAVNDVVEGIKAVITEESED